MVSDGSTSLYYISLSLGFGNIDDQHRHKAQKKTNLFTLVLRGRCITIIVGVENSSEKNMLCHVVLTPCPHVDGGFPNRFEIEVVDERVFHHRHQVRLRERAQSGPIRGFLCQLHIQNSPHSTLKLNITC